LKGVQSRGYETDQWTLKRIAQVIEEEFGEKYTEPGVWRLSQQTGFSG
jgi:transposase